MLYHLVVAVVGSALMLALVAAALWALGTGDATGCAAPAERSERSGVCRACGLRAACHPTGETL